jgi:outer membrane protein
MYPSCSVAAFLHRCCPPAVVTVVLAAGLPVVASAQSSLSEDGPWSMRTRIQLSGSSDLSEDEGYRVYSGVPIEISVRRELGGRFGLEFSGALESREVDVAASGVSDRVNLGSIQTLPINVLVQYYFRPGSARVEPYAGVGANLTLFWEKSGALDSSDLSPGGGLAVQLGTDIALSNAVVFNLDLKWNQLATDLELDGNKLARLFIHPLTFGAGFGFRF